MHSTLLLLFELCLINPVRISVCPDGVVGRHVRLGPHTVVDAGSVVAGPIAVQGLFFGLIQSDPEFHLRRKKLGSTRLNLKELVLPPFGEKKYPTA